jgi:hypothetical protein
MQRQTSKSKVRLQGLIRTLRAKILISYSTTQFVCHSAGTWYQNLVTDSSRGSVMFLSTGTVLVPGRGTSEVLMHGVLKP